ncbi:MAG: ATP-binding protein [Prevotella sp.]|uniref:ATP-binding protein n=1 Tax=Prevotella sp. TaxID=59823 RepID=UPI0025FF729A|nr:ATP-binding protein [Prevotella sp.]MCI7183862.1 ATP-binding protein [Prevotella sp.]
MKYPIGIQDFVKLRQGGFAYVDKTKFVYKLADEGSYYFLSRPRRFGKSLFLSTLEAYFHGRKELFEGLAIYDMEKEWKSHPIFYIDLNTANFRDENSLYEVLNSHVSVWEEMYGAREYETTLALRFKGVIARAAEKGGRGVVILIDEYDKPILQTLRNQELQEKHRSLLKSFYSVLKTQDRYIRFAFITGVTKFGKVSVFSDLNNLMDISMDQRYISICGMTQDELLYNFREGIEQLGEAYGDTEEETLNKLKIRYDGYHFEEDTVGIYNPFSVLNTLAKLRYKDYWFETGTPTFLVDLLKMHNYRLPDITREKVSDDVINSVDSMSTNPIPVIYQSGYLTIKGYDERFKKYRLGFPNKEVEEGFLNFLLPLYTSAGNNSPFMVDEFVTDVESGNPERFMQRMKAFFADTSYQVVGDAELYFQNAMYLVFKIMGFYTQVERPTSDGRIDAVIQTPDYIYIIECKLDRTAEEALRQINDSGYAEPFAMDKRRIYKIGVNFSSQTRGVEQWIIE